MEHIFYTCPPGCEKPYCAYCQGGLAFCITCKQGESELTPECPGPIKTREGDSYALANI